MLTGDLLGFQKAVDEIDSEVEGFRHKLEFNVNVDKPVDEDGTHFVIDIALVGHVVISNADLGFSSFVEGHHVRDEGTGSKRVVLVCIVDMRAERSTAELCHGLNGWCWSGR